VRKLNHFVVDEAHSSLGLEHDFRPEHEQASVLRDIFPKAPMMGLMTTMECAFRSARSSRTRSIS
jgi:superfamily II DNA helicase RecQ